MGLRHPVNDIRADMGDISLGNDENVLQCVAVERSQKSARYFID